MVKIGMYLLITARVEPSRWDPNKLDFKIGTVNLLQDEKDKLIEKISITVPIHDLDEPTKFFQRRTTLTINFKIDILVLL